LEDIRGRLLQIFQDAITHERQVVDDVKQQHVDTMLTIVNNDYTNPNLNVDEVAARLGLSTNYVRILFKEATNSSLSEYLNQVRFEKARQLLLETDIPVKDVCGKIGISNVNYFYTAFKKYSGFTPTQFRQNEQQHLH
jgi:YesN/AraC family two-component response regulator